MTKKFRLYFNDKKNNSYRCFITINLEPYRLTNNYNFSASLNIYKNLSWTTGGQCFEDFYQIISKLPDSPEKNFFNKIYKVWKNYQLNDMHAGTERQEKFLEEYYKKNPDEPHNYNNEVKILGENNLYEDNGYVFGTDWLRRDIPQDVIDEILSW